MRRVRGGHEHALVCQARRRRRHVGGGRHGEHAGAPLLLQRRHRPLRLDARLPVPRGPVPERPARHGDERHDAPAPLGGQQRGHARLLPRRRQDVCQVQRRAPARPGALRRGHEGGREPGFHQPGIHKQRDVLPRPQPPVRPVHQVLPVARPGPGPLWPRRDSGSKPTRFQTLHPPLSLHTCYTTSTTVPQRRATHSHLACPSLGRTPAGGGARASRSRPRATAWSRSSSPSTRRWCTRRPKQRRRPRLPRHQRHPTKCLYPRPCVCACRARQPPLPPILL